MQSLADAVDMLLPVDEVEAVRRHPRRDAWCIGGDGLVRSRGGGRLNGRTHRGCITSAPVMRVDTLGKIDPLAGLNQCGVRNVRVDRDDIVQPDTMVAGNTGKLLAAPHDMETDLRPIPECRIRHAKLPSRDDRDHHMEPMFHAAEADPTIMLSSGCRSNGAWRGVSADGSSDQAALTIWMQACGQCL